MNWIIYLLYILVNTKRQKMELKDAVKQAKEAGSVTDYHGALSRSTLVILTFWKKLK